VRSKIGEIGDFFRTDAEVLASALAYVAGVPASHTSPSKAPHVDYTAKPWAAAGQNRYECCFAFAVARAFDGNGISYCLQCRRESDHTGNGQIRYRNGYIRY
jgi:hypothetical protein